MGDAMRLCWGVMPGASAGGWCEMMAKEELQMGSASGRGRERDWKRGNGGECVLHLGFGRAWFRVRSGRVFGREDAHWKRVCNLLADGIGLAFAHTRRTTTSYSRRSRLRYRGIGRGSIVGPGEVLSKIKYVSDTGMS
ncbi:hypothetical protein BU26DRAFT_87314 [Trematosphaeria pertusa]|uniref:Uncharacterized protein n=1 Tax=Trematosphaeria pertusa TaxID=390896 RepID=A0A6A6I3K6_9PLEO|nr:uncharacterized protein BU26DRAFT_87314 [Trematosphaeria pertusa]KAF2244837.1 hypothetical protein BU26DRAFT_87314 [Trematosphaeria pertusa]